MSYSGVGFRGVFSRRGFIRFMFFIVFFVVERSRRKGFGVWAFIIYSDLYLFGFFS